ncbi:MAG: hypothetical protein AB7O78_17745 [Thermoleophilia bacterium]
MIPSADLRAEILVRLRQLADAHPERSVHLAIDVAQHGRPLSIPACQVALEQLWEAKQVVHVGRGWRLPPDGIQMEIGA